MAEPISALRTGLMTKLISGASSIPIPTPTTSCGPISEPVVLASPSESTKEQAGALKPTDVYLFRVAQMLGDYAVHGAVLRRYSRVMSRLAGDGADTIARFRASLQAAGNAVSTVRTYSTVAGQFIGFLDTRGGIGRCDAAAATAFVATLAGYQFKTVEQKLCAVQSFLRFAAGDGLCDAAVLDAVPAVKSRTQTRIPSVWDPADVMKMLDAVDRGNPFGKRDYAIILLITRLGLRGIDVKRLEFGDFDWPGNRLSVMQVKTGRRVWLPLLKDVGWAVIEYIRAGRPRSDCPQVFLRHVAPIGPFSDQDHLHQILLKHARGRACPCQRETAPRHAFAAAHAGDPGDATGHPDRADRRHPGSPVCPIDRGVSEIVAGSVGPVRAGPGRAGVGVGGDTMTAGITLAEAITALVAEKRAVGYKYVTEERALARFEAFCRIEFPELVALKRVSVEAWVTGPRRRGVIPATLQGLAAPVRELAPLAGPPRHCRLRAARRRVAPALAVRPAHLHRPGIGGAVHPNRPLPLLRGGPAAPPGHAGAVPDDLRLRPALLRGPPGPR